MLNFRQLPCVASEYQSRTYYRSGELTGLSSALVKYLLKKLHINYFIDLRSTQEITTNGCPEKIIRQGGHWFSFPLEADTFYFRDKKYPDIQDYYQYSVSLLENNKRLFADIFRLISKNPQGKFLFSCYAGKDRTGLLAILILLVYRVPKEIIIKDYLLTGPSLLTRIDYFEKNWIKKGLTKQEYGERMQPNEKTVTLLMEYIESRYINIDNYLMLIGLSQNEIMNIKGLL